MASTLPGSGVLQAATTGENLTNSPTPAGINLTTGWWVFFGVAGAVLVSGTVIAPLALGFISVALLYQLTQLVEGK